VHPLLSPFYEGIARTATLLTLLPLPGDGKVIRALRDRRDARTALVAWGGAHRDPTRPLLWVHAPSVGEGLMAEPVLRALSTAHPDWQVLYTYFSPSAARFASRLPVTYAGPLPFDSARAADALLDALRPTALVVSKLDLWPRLTERAHARGVRLGMISATLSAGSGRAGALARALLHDAYAALDAVGAVDPADADRLVALGVRRDRITVTGDTRYDQCAARTAATDRASALLAPLGRTRPTVVAGSTWPGDERVLGAAWPALRVAVPEARLIIAPHEPTEAHLAPIERWATASGLRVARLTNASADADVVVVDRVGVLHELYALAEAAYVGGGFHAAGLHSVIEPASFGVPVLFGPHHTRSRDAGLLLEARAAEAVPDAAALTRALRILLTEPDTRARAGAAAQGVVTAGRGAANASVALIEGLIDPTSATMSPR
jgi:3-deoxy-D-manno-octulosonic-acid transferase